MHGQFVWYELTTPDVEAAQKFYPRFTGWRTQAFDNDYTMFTLGGAPVAGIFRLSAEMRQQGVPPNWMPYVETGNVDDTAAKAAALGGMVIVPPADIPGTGRFAVLRDPQGATFGVYKSATASGAWDGTPVVGRFSWHELMTTDHAAAFEFYRALFGWSKTGEMDMGGGQMYVLVGKGQAPYGGLYTRPSEMAGMHPFWLVYINVKDVGKAVAAATKAGATVHRPQMDIPGGSIAILGDPQGAGYAVHHANPVAAPEPAVTKAATAVKSAAKAVQSAAKAVTKVATKAAKKVAKKAAKRVAKASAQARARIKPKVTRKAKPKVAKKAKPRPKAKARKKAKARTTARKVTKRRSAPRKSAPKSRRAGKARARKK